MVIGTEKNREGLEQLLNRVLSDQEELRSALARELHNELGALLTGISLELSSLQSPSVARSPEVEAALDSSRALLREAVTLKRRFIERLYPSTLGMLGLGVALETLAMSFGDAYGLAMEAAVGDVELPVANGMGIDLYRVAEAALENVVRHASARTVQLVLSRSGDWLVLVIRDDGIGFDLATIGPTPGFQLMRYRLARWHGDLQLASAPGVGASLTARAPVWGASA